MTLFAMRDRDSVLAIRFAVSPLWETQAAVQALADERGRSYHQPWVTQIRHAAGALDLAPLLEVLPRYGYVPDFLTPPPLTSAPDIGSQLAQIRATDPGQAARELDRCLGSVAGERSRPDLADMISDPQRAVGQLADLLTAAWAALVEPYWARIQALLDRDIAERARVLARHGLRRVLADLDRKIRWSSQGLVLPDRSDRVVEISDRGLVLMPSAYLWPNVAAIVEEPWQPTIIYPAAGIAGLWQAAQPAPEALARLLGKTRARVLVALDQPLSTTTLAAATGLSPAGASRHLLALRDAGLASTVRNGHEVRYHRTELGSALMQTRKR